MLDDFAKNVTNDDFTEIRRTAGLMYSENIRVNDFIVAMLSRLDGVDQDQVGLAPLQLMYGGSGCTACTAAGWWLVLIHCGKNAPKTTQVLKIRKLFELLDRDGEAAGRPAQLAKTDKTSPRDRLPQAQAP